LSSKEPLKLHIKSINMDALKNAVGMGDNGQQSSGNQQSSVNQSTEQKQGGGFLGGLGDKFNSAAGGGRESEKNEDYLDKGTLQCVCDAVLALFSHSRAPNRKGVMPMGRAPFHCEASYIPRHSVDRCDTPSSIVARALQLQCSTISTST